jgi:hypothetical protein
LQLLRQGEPKLTIDRDLQLLLDRRIQVRIQGRGLLVEKKTKSRVHSAMKSSSLILNKRWLSLAKNGEKL